MKSAVHAAAPPAGPAGRGFRSIFREGKIGLSCEDPDSTIETAAADDEEAARGLPIGREAMIAQTTGDGFTVGGSTEEWLRHTIDFWDGCRDAETEEPDWSGPMGADQPDEAPLPADFPRRELRNPDNRLALALFCARHDPEGTLDHLSQLSLEPKSALMVLAEIGRVSAGAALSALEGLECAEDQLALIKGAGDKKLTPLLRRIEKGEVAPSRLELDVRVALAEKLIGGGCHCRAESELREISRDGCCGRFDRWPERRLEQLEERKVDLRSELSAADEAARGLLRLWSAFDVPVEALLEDFQALCRRVPQAMSAFLKRGDVAMRDETRRALQSEVDKGLEDLGDCR